MAGDPTVAISGVAPADGRSALFRFLFVHEIDEYPNNRKRTFYLGLAVLSTIVLYYTYFTQTGVTPNLLVYFHMSFSYYVGIVIISNLIGAFASLPASKTDKIGRSNVVIYGLLLVGLIVTFAIPACKTELQFAIAICALGLVEGAILVATPALVRDFSPQLGRATAMGFWTIGPVAGSLLTSIVATNTLSHFGTWQSQFRISGITCLVVFVIALFWLKDLSYRLREQLIVSERDRALVEAKAQGLSESEVAAATAHPWRQILKLDLIGSSVGISIYLLVYFAASAFFTIYWATVFKNPNGLNLSTVQANSLNQWYWGADAITLIIFGVLSDLLRVRKPLMLVGALGSTVMLIIFLRQATHPYTSFHTLVLLEVLLATFISLTYAPWMAAYTESVEARNPALVGTGLALWGWILRLTVGISFIFLPMVVTSVNPIVNNLPLAQTTINGKPFNAQAFQLAHPKSVAFAEANASWLKVLTEPKVAPVVAKLNTDLTPANLVAFQKLVSPYVFNKTVANAAKLKTLVVPYEAELTFLANHQSQLTDLENGVAKSPEQWQHWFWVCVGGMILFIPTIFFSRGRWSMKRARQDAEEHEQGVADELKELVGANT
jgi:MFS family permease